MEFELGRTYSGYKFLDVVRRSRSVVQYRVQNTLAQRLENLQTLPAAAVRRSGRFGAFSPRGANSRPPAAPARRFVLYRAAGRRPHGDDHGVYDGLASARRAAAARPAAVARRPWTVSAPDAGRAGLPAPAVLRSLRHHAREHSVRPRRILQALEFCAGPSAWIRRTPPNRARSSATRKYISPEQVKGGRELDRRSDLYSLGVVLYEMLCGRPPFESRSQFELMLAHVNQAPAPPSGVNATVPQFLDAVVLKALAKDPADRYPSAAAFADAIASFHAEAVQADASAVTDSLSGDCFRAGDER